ncbi:hypothetical protein AB0A74_22170 [Saccharothrix sp. NPDC042600]|uniref:hypothetical protein n=1 Tax=Saccharothrix TaxID=2071 RepID=UPI0033D0F1AD|nr:hypothetical protein GCM10017745_53320 [Saccharothrix mutabilis subsp. capreolus]
MGVLTDYFRASDHDTVRTALDHNDAMSPLMAPLRWDGVEAKAVDPEVVLAQLVTAADPAADPDDNPLVWPATADPDHEGPWVVALDPTTRDTLAAAHDDDLPTLATHWARIEEWNGDPTPDELLPLVTELVQLARRARDTGDHLYCWMSL